MVLTSLAFATFSILQEFVDNEVPSFQLFFLTSSTALILISPFYIVYGNKRLNRKNIKLYILRSIIVTVALSIWLNVLSLMPTIDAVSISYTLPLINTLFGIIILKEPASKPRFLSILISLIAAYFILQPVLKTDFYLVLFALIVPILWSISDILLKIQTKSAPPIAQTFYLLCATSLCALPVASIEWQPVTQDKMFVIYLMGLFFLINAFSAFKAYSLGDLGYVAGFDFTRLIFTIVICSYFFGEKISGSMLFGCTLIFGASIYSTYMERHRHIQKTRKHKKSYQTG